MGGAKPPAPGALSGACLPSGHEGEGLREEQLAHGEGRVARASWPGPGTGLHGPLGGKTAAVWP